MTDYAEYVLLPKLYAELRKLAPHLTLKILSYNEFSPEDFENTQLEIGIGLEESFPKQLISQRIFSDNTVCVAHENHSIFKQRLTLKRYLKAEHLATCVYSEKLPRADEALHKLNLQRNIKLSLPNALSALETLSTSSLVGTFSKNIITQSEQYPLKYVVPPFAIPDYHIVQIWHRQQANDGGLIWLRALVKKTCDRYFSNNV